MPADLLFCQLTSQYLLCWKENVSISLQCLWMDWLLVFTLVCLSSVNKIRSGDRTLLTTRANRATTWLLPLQPSQEKGQSNSAQCVKGSVGSWGCLSSHKENRGVCVCLTPQKTQHPVYQRKSLGFSWNQPSLHLRLWTREIRSKSKNSCSIRLSSWKLLCMTRSWKVGLR